MDRQAAAEQYNYALKLGQKYFRSSILRGKYPYPQVFNEIYRDNVPLLNIAALGINNH